ncbi:unnamed protein product [Clavelina lepadiformis]|uniref:Uncharacterized protein n=1 Tax=Clavelina lepadiformis TaxID=159417 RepID=A0ABP0F0Z2_CLALP
MAERRKRATRSRSKQEKKDKDDALKPDINVKVDELFVRWFSLPTTQRALKDGLRLIRQRPEKDSIGDQEDYQPTESSSSPTPAPPTSQSPPPPNNVKPLVSPRRKSFNKNRLSESLKWTECRSIFFLNSCKRLT